MKKILAWFIGISFAMGAVNYAIKLEWVAFLACFISSFILLPPTAKLIKFKLHWVVKLIIVFICFTLIATVRVTDAGKAELAKIHQESQAKQEIKDKERAERKAKEEAEQAERKAKEDAIKAAEATKKARGNIIGDTIQLDNFVYTVHKTEWKGVIGWGGSYSKEADASYLVVRLSIKNNDTQPRRIPTLILVDEKGSQYAINTEATFYLKSDKLDLIKPLNPGVLSAGGIVFDIPKDKKYSLVVPGEPGSKKTDLIKLY